MLRSRRPRLPTQPGAAVAPAERARLLRRLATLVEEHHEELSRIESQNVGKPISGARGEVGMVAQVFHFYAGAVDKHSGDTIPVAGGVAATFREPLGVVGLIVPWNFPLNIASWKIGPALACGNTVVLKPAELTPLSVAAPRRAGAGGRYPRGRLQRRHRARARRRAAVDRAPGRRKDRLHGLDRGRPDGDGRRRGDDQAGHSRARRQVRQRRLRRRRPRARGRSGSVRRLRQRRPGLLCPFAHPRRAPRVRPLRRAARRGDARRPRGRPCRRRTEMGPLISAQHREQVASFVDGELLFRGERPTARATGTRARSSRRRTTTASPARKSSAPSRRSSPSTTRRTRSARRTTRPTACPARSGRATGHGR